MSLQYIFEIENFDAGKNLAIDVDSVSFAQFPHLSVTAVGTSQKAAEQAKEITIIRKFDEKNSHLFTAQIGKSFPKAVLQVKSSGSRKSYLFTFLKPYLDSSYIYDNSGTFEKSKFSFDHFSIKESSPVGNNASPGRKKTSDRLQEQMMNYLRN